MTSAASDHILDIGGGPVAFLGARRGLLPPGVEAREVDAEGGPAVDEPDAGCEVGAELAAEGGGGAAAAVSNGVSEKSHVLLGSELDLNASSADQ